MDLVVLPISCSVANDPQPLGPSAPRDRRVDLSEEINELVRGLTRTIRSSGWNNRPG